MLEQATASTLRQSLLRTLIDELDRPEPAFLSGPAGIGKSHTLAALAGQLGRRGIPHIHTGAKAAGARDVIANAEPDSVILVDDYDNATFELLEAIAQRIVSGAKFFGTADLIPVASGYSEHLGKLYESVPRLRELMIRAHMIPLDPLEPEQIARLVHHSIDGHLDAATVTTIAHLSWGRPGWAIDLLHLWETGSLKSVPLPRITRVSAEELYLPSFQVPAGLTTHDLSPEDAAIAIALAEIGPRSRNGVADVAGLDSKERLLELQLLVAPVDDTDLMGVPELYAAALERLTDADTLTRTRTRIADHLLAQEAIGIPLAGRESIFCARALGRNGKRSKGQDLDDHQAEFLLRIIDDLTSFGEGHQARDLLLRLGTRGHDIDDLTRARLTALLSDAHSGLQLLVSSHQVSSASSFKDLEAQEQFAHLLLRGHLSAEAGLPPDFAADFAADDPALADALLVAQRWNDTAPLGKDRSDLLRIARTHEQPEVALLAEQLLALDAALIGCSYPSFSELPVEQRISRLAIGAVASRRDALVCASVTQAVIRFFTSGGERADRPLISLPDRLPGATRHRVWATHIHTARIAMLVGDLERAHAEWAEFVRRTPRFIPRRLSAIIERMGATRTAETGQGNEAHSLIGNTQQVLGYFAGTLDHVNGAAFAPLRERPGPFIGNLSKEDRAGIAELSEIAPIRAHLDAHRTQNPLALMRAADGLMEFGFCAPASYALQEARRIFLKRRASGSVGTADARLAEVRARAARYAPWLETEELPKPTRERLTPRETTAATLAASGLTNRSIAEEMGCSVRTVESHISQARAKLGASSRDELAEQLRALGVLAGRSVSLAPKREAALDSR